MVEPIRFLDPVKGAQMLDGKRPDGPAATGWQGPDGYVYAGPDSYAQWQRVASGAAVAPRTGRTRRFPASLSRCGVHTALAAVPVMLVNAVAFAGQLAFLRSHLPWPLAGQVTMAVALESIAVYLAFHAHVAQLANDSALRLRLAAYTFAAVIAAMNYSHYAAPHWRPTFPAVAVGLMSAASPWLWAVHSRRASRDELLAKGLIEPHAVRLGSTRWTWHPVRSARVMWHATWEGITDPAAAIETAKARELPAVDLDAVDLPALSARDRLAIAFGVLGRVDVPAALALLADRGAPVDQSYSYQIRRAMLDGQDGGQ
jgi:hypothetical protein